ncbi:hypothetical protein KUCAC02_002093 [Chaenocephalus aceratus]|uniref:Uncharacterized protein n=1 Tax=Chaenocephalus aceratus TaxID=36190 RepID=A0ACB9XTZ9_CHAAC|nr:hypothetical protein KUCAC02_002093 [Chaenocephalus aceratus]
MDLHKKGVFTMAVSEIEAPPPEFEGNRDNPCRVSPSFHKWAPWIGPRTRSGKCVLNTEFSKVKKSDADQVDIDVTEEHLSTELTNLKVEALRNLVKGCGVDSKGSKIDLILRLREAMKTRSTYDKVFEKVWGASVQADTQADVSTNEHEVATDVSMTQHCGNHCEALTMTSNIRPCRTSWTPGVHHPLQEQLVNNVLDETRPMEELIVKDCHTCLTRKNLVTLGLKWEMDSMVGHAYLRLIHEAMQYQGKDVFIVDLHVPPTWLAPNHCDARLSLPVDSHKRDALISPLWTPGHFVLCVSDSLVLIAKPP